MSEVDLIRKRAFLCKRNVSGTVVGYSRKLDMLTRKSTLTHVSVRWYSTRQKRWITSSESIKDVEFLNGLDRAVKCLPENKNG